MQFVTPISYTQTDAPWEEKIFAFDIMDDEILFPEQFIDDEYRRWINSLIADYHAEWGKCVDLQAGESFTFTAVKGNSQLPFPLNRIHAARINDHKYIGVLFIIITNLINSKDQQQEQMERVIEYYKKERDDFFDLALHDLQSPVRRLSILLDRLAVHEGALLDQDIKPYIDRMKTVTAELTSINKGLNSLYDANAASNVFEDCDLNTVVTIAVEELKTVDSLGEIKLLKGKLPVVTGNFNQLKMLFENILHNAVKFHKKGKEFVIKIESEVTSEGIVSNKKEANKNIFYKITVKDDGIGFNQEHGEKIFEPFIRLNGNSAYPGSGMGLAVCRKIVENHHGNIYAESVKEDGCSVVVILPEK